MEKQTRRVRSALINLGITGLPDALFVRTTDEQRITSFQFDPVCKAMRDGFAALPHIVGAYSDILPPEIAGYSSHRWLWTLPREKTPTTRGRGLGLRKPISPRRWWGV
jgi:hypothetical protein